MVSNEQYQKDKAAVIALWSTRHEHERLAFEFVLNREGGYVNDESDNGGETYMGVSSRYYPELFNPLPTSAQIAQVYVDTWERYKCGLLPNWAAVAVFDGVFNQSPIPTIKKFQRAVGVEPDGYIGPVTSAATPDYYQYEPTIICNFFARRASRYSAAVRANPSQLRFLTGWQNRLFELLAEIMEM